MKLSLLSATGFLLFSGALVFSPTTPLTDHEYMGVLRAQWYQEAFASFHAPHRCSAQKFQIQDWHDQGQDERDILLSDLTLKILTTVTQRGFQPIKINLSMEPTTIPALRLWLVAAYDFGCGLQIKFWPQTVFH